ncbi:alpha/beta hydrolase [Yoonia maritima]|uniref:alpha/beta hydrolase n=1 Tax=Yoonia maritima TaxID=1435347 RepID=UPI000D0F4583|nr:alpha/beta hydrolase [Yoonia maritima]
MMKYVSFLLCASTFCTAGFAQTVDGTKFRAIEEGQWYHPIEPEMWTYFGADETTVYEILERVADSDGPRVDPDQPDTQIAYGPGNWIYEFTLAGDAAMAAGNHKAAAIYYHTASAPHTNDPNSVAALQSANAAYVQAASTVASDFEVVDIAHENQSFQAFLHLPEGEGPFPVLVMSNGSDMSKVTALNYYETHLQPKGIAFLTLDTPGMGDSIAYDVRDGQTDKLHAAAAAWAKTQPNLQSNNVFLQGVSFGGNAAARLFLDKPELDLAGVIYTCGPLHQAFLAPPEAYENFPRYTIDGVKIRVGLELDASYQDLADAVRVLSLENQGLFDGDKITTPLLAINTHDDPVASLDDMSRLLDQAENAESVVFHLPGHCPPHNQREAIVSAWIISNLRD